MGYREDYQEAARLSKQAQDLQSEWEAKKEAPPADVLTQIDTLLDQAITLEQTASEAEAREQKFGRLQSRLHSPDPARALPLPPPGPAPDAAGAAREAAFRKALVQGLHALDATERKDLTTINGPQGGYLVAPVQWQANLIRFVNDNVFMRRLGTVLPPVTGAASVGYPSLETDPADADWTGEITQSSADTAMKFGKRELKPSPLSKEVVISKPLLARVSDADSLIRDRLGYKFSIAMEKAYMTGTGANQPLGIFTASTQGISTGRDATAASATAIAFDDLIETQFTLKGQYWPRATWVFSRTVLKAVRKLKDSVGYYIWQPASMPSIGPTILDMPYVMSEYAPSTISASQYVAALGDMSYYYIVDSLEFAIQVLVELYARTNENSYLGRAETDGMPVLEEAFVRLQMHS